MAKSKPTVNLASHAATSSSTVKSPIESKSSRILRAQCQSDWRSTGRFVAREHNKDAASSSQVLAKRCRKGREYEETRCNRNEPGSSEFSGGKLGIHRR